MSFNTGFPEDGGERHDRVAPRAGSDYGAGVDPQIEHVLRDFRQSVHSWSDAVYQRPRQVEVASRRSAWRTAAAWALGSVLVVGGVGSGFFEHHHRQELARIAATREAEHQRRLQEERASQAEQELAQVDRYVSREVPDALEPLASLMGADESQ